MLNSPLQKIENSFLNERKISVYVKRDDLIHPFISGNKWRKCHYLLKHIQSHGFKRVITFGGAYSNHIHAFSYACALLGLESMGVIRGEELNDKPLNKTLEFAKQQGMTLKFVTRDEYRLRNDIQYIEQLSKDHAAYVVPEGGTTQWAVGGFKDMLDEIRVETSFDYIMVPCGSGGTISGINANLNSTEQVIGINVLKGTEPDLLKTLAEFSIKQQYRIESDYHWGGYGKTHPDLERFIIDFERTYNIEIEKVYSAKMFYAFFDMAAKGFFDGKTVILNHTGGLQSKQK